MSVVRAVLKAYNKVRIYNFFLKHKNAIIINFITLFNNSKKKHLVIRCLACS